MPFEIDLKGLEKDYSIMSVQEFALLRRSCLIRRISGDGRKAAIRRSPFLLSMDPSVSSDTSSPNTALVREDAVAETFEDIVEWAYNTLPQRIKDLPDFPGIQVVDELPAGLLETYPEHANALGLFVGRSRIEREYTNLHRAPDLIFVFQGPLIRYSKRDQRDLRSQVKQTVWHEVAHWLGYNEEDMKELGL